ncbi:nitrate reductase molybdenum cofactor assembly chaperone [Rhizobium straminoryzae]|uniref:Nitrate reductase molybdenum cofactor assembly chaperone n=1 Tax=Rhizobium straminoryzae TaxID=1387186 RepID=A0A549T6Q1_9HYPH|nr:nitrate reductase molybdenum cofactor assembly chaperone [Rhizobium straminoryzae]TRL37549.1 nitrate reductase molybdenum cofactor assembly chaperone [Rhizobium straminoryzae]
MDIAFKIASLLLSYPDQDLMAALPELKAALARRDVAEPVRLLFSRLIDDLARLDLLEAQERYVHLFDRSRSLSLHLFEHVHGEGRDRGQAMVDLKTMYEGRGFEIDAREMPDYLPLFLEFLSVLPSEEAHELLAQTAHIVAAIGARLKKRPSVYANAFAALSLLTRSEPDAALLSALLLAEEDDPDDLEALDRIWEEEAVTFGGNAGEGACGPDRLRMQVRAAQRRPAAHSATPN